MLEATHRRIAKEIAKELNLNEREASLLEVGSVNPDSWANFPHHEGKEHEIAKNILEARKLYVQNDDECFASLGNALHYIQDRWTMRPRLSDKHTKWEESINLAPILDDSQLENEIKQALLPTKAEKAYLSFLEDLKKGLVSISDETSKQKWDSLWKERFPLFFSEEAPPYMPPYVPHQLLEFLVSPSGVKVICYALQNRPTTWSNPVLDLNFAYRICLEVARNVFSQEHDKKDWLETPPKVTPMVTPMLTENPLRPFGIMLFIFSFMLLIIAFANVGNLLFPLLLGFAFILLAPAILLYFGKKPAE